MKKEELWTWGDEYRRLFTELKELFTKDLILKIYQLALNIIVKIDILDFILEVYLL